MELSSRTCAYHVFADEPYNNYSRYYQNFETRKELFFRSTRMRPEAASWSILEISLWSPTYFAIGSKPHKISPGYKRRCSEFSWPTEADESARALLSHQEHSLLLGGIDRARKSLTTKLPAT